MNRITYTVAGGVVRTMRIATPDLPILSEFSVMEFFKKGDQNGVRRWFAILRKNGFFDNPNDFALVEDGNDWKLLVYTRNWDSRAAHLSGFVAGFRRANRNHRRHKSKA